jgi:hypothetical protein
MTRFRAWRARRRHDRHLRWLRRAKVLLPSPEPQCRRPGPEAVCCAVGAVLLLGVTSAAHAEAFASLNEPSTFSLMGVGLLVAAGSGLIARWPAGRYRDPRMSRRHPGRQCNCLACVDAYPDH